MSEGISTAAVIGSGVMGSAIAAQFAGAGIRTHLLDVLPRDLPLFFAQIVLTVLAPSRLGQVVFTQQGIPYPAVKGDGTVLESGVPAVWEDYEALILSDSERSILPTTTSSTTPS